MQYLLARKRNILNAGLALLLTAGAFGFCGIAESYVSVLYFLASYAVYGLICRTQEIKKTEIKYASLFFSVLLTASFAAGHQINIDTQPYFPDLSLLEWAYLLPFGGLIHVCVLNLVDWVMDHGLSFDREGQEVEKAFWRKTFFVLMVLWMPYFLVFYPGNLSWDSITSVEQVMGTQPWSNWHPVVFSAAVGLFMKLGMQIGDINFGIACYTFAQMVVFGSILSYCVYWMKKKGVADYILLLTAGFFALDPVIATYAVTMWKDVLFSAYTLLLVLMLADIAESDGMLLTDRRKVAKLIAVYFLIAFWRNNGIYVLMAVTAVLGIVYRKYWKRFLPTCMTALCVIMIIQGPIYEKMGIAPSNFSESAGILLQQIAYTLDQNGTIDAESLAFLEQIMPIERWTAAYSPGGADSIKFDSQFDTEFLNANSSEFLQVWFRILPKNFVCYVKAWLMNTLGYYHIGTDAAAVWYGVIPLEQVDVLQIYRTDLLQMVMNTDIVASVIEAFLFYMYKMPVFSIIYSIAASVWSVFLCVLILILRKRYRYLLPIFPLIALWGTMMIAAPVNCGFRYLFSFHLALPLILLFMFWDHKGRKLL